MVEGSGFMPGEPLSLHLDSGQGWNAAADAFGNFTTSTTYGPRPSPTKASHGGVASTPKGRSDNAVCDRTAAAHCCVRCAHGWTGRLRVREAAAAALALLPLPVCFAGFRFPPDVIVLAVRWSLRFGLSHRDVEELLAGRGVEVDHVTVYRWAVRFTPLLADAARPCRHQVGDRRQLDETYAKVSVRRDANAARRFFQRAIGATKITLA